MIVTTFVTAYLIIGAICTTILVSACIVAGRSEKSVEDLNEPVSRDAHAPQPVKQTTSDSRRTYAHLA